MYELLFTLGFIVLVVLFIKRNNIVEFLNYNLATNLTNQSMVYILALFFVALITAGMLMGDTKKKYGNISTSYENLKPQEEKRPHTYFDVNTYD